MTEQLEHTPPTALEALEHVWSTGWHSLCIQTPGFPFRTFGFYDNPEELLAVAAMNPDANCWFGVHGLNEVPAKGRGSRDDVGNIIALSADFDWADDEAHADAELPDELEVRRIVAEMSPAPTLVIDSGHGLQAYWTLMVELDRKDGETLIDGFFRFVERTTGLKNDRVDIASILRVPGSLNQKTEPQRTVGIGTMLNEGYFPDWLLENCWDAEPSRIVEQPARRIKVDDITEIARTTHHTPDDETPKDFMCRTYDGYAALIRLGWQPGPRRGDEEQLTRPGKDPRMGTSAVFHHDTDVCNIFTTTIHPDYGRIGLSSKNGVVTLNPFDIYCIENGLHPKDAMSIIRKTLMPSTPRPRSATPAGEEATDAEEDKRPTALNLPDEFWEARPQLRHIRDAAWNKITCPDAVLAGVVARYAALLPPTVQIPDNTLDIFFVTHGPSGSGKSTAGRASAKLFTRERPKDVMLDQNVGSGEGLAEAFFEWRDEEGNPCSGSKKGAMKVMTKWGLHFATDEGQALTASAGRMGSILIPTLCSAWMGEGIGQRLADPTKSRMIAPNKVRITAEIRIQTANGYKLFQEEYATTGLSQRMICLSAQDPRLSDPTFPLPNWPGELHLPTPDLIQGGRQITLCPEIAAINEAARRSAHSPLLVVDPLDTHSALAQLKLAGILALWDERTEISIEDYELAEIVLNTHKVNRTKLKQTHTARQEQARLHRDTQQAVSEVTVEKVKDAANLTRCIEVLRGKLKDGKRIKRSDLTVKLRPYREEALEALALEGVYEPSEH